MFSFFEPLRAISDGLDPVLLSVSRSTVETKPLSFEFAASDEVMVVCLSITDVAFRPLNISLKIASACSM